MTFSIYTHDEIAGATIAWDPTIERTPALEHAAGQGDWPNIGRLVHQWTQRCGLREVTYEPGALVLHDGYEIYLVEQPRGETN